MLTRAELKVNAKLQLQDRWGRAVLLCLIYFSISIVANLIAFIFSEAMLFPEQVLSSLMAIFMYPPLALGMHSFFLKISRNQEVAIDELFSKFNLYLKSVGLMLLITIFTTLWSLLLIVPGIIAAYRYRQAFYILLDNPEMTPLEAISASKKIMIGHKMELFILDLSFIGWALLVILTLFVGTLWLAPYINVTYANYYDNLMGTFTVEEDERVKAL